MSIVNRSKARFESNVAEPTLANVIVQTERAIFERLLASHEEMADVVASRLQRKLIAKMTRSLKDEVDMSFIDDRFAERFERQEQRRQDAMRWNDEIDRWETIQGRGHCDND
jgi:hypothetical protein